MAPKGKVSQSQRAGLILPVARISRMMRNGNYAPRFTAGAPIYMTAVLEYLAFEILDLAIAADPHSKRVRITPRQIHLAIRYDEELSNFCDSITIPEAGVVPRTIFYPGKHGKSSPSSPKGKAAATHGHAGNFLPDC